MKTQVWLWVHGVKTALWAGMIPVALLTDLKTSVPFLVFLSLEALVESSWASWQAVRSEKAAQKDE